MKISSVLLIAGAAFVAAQDLTKLPDCAKACAGDLLLGSNCGIDPKCICSNSSFLTDIAACVSKGCTKPAELDATVAFAVDICKAVNISIDTGLISTSTAAADSTATIAPTTTTKTTASASTIPTGTNGGKNDTISTPKPTDKVDESAGEVVRSSLIGVVAAVGAAVLLL